LPCPRLLSVRVGEQSEWMKLIPALLIVGMLAVIGCSKEVKKIEPYSPELVKKAEAGDANAQCDLAFRYTKGKGVPQDYKEAVKWYTKAAEQGNAKAQYNLGSRYANGEGVTQDYKEAVKWYTKSAEQGNGFAQYHLSVCYHLGRGVTKDNKEATKWRAKASEQKEANAKEQLEKLKSL